MLRIHGEDIAAGTAATLFSKGFLEAAWVFSSRRQPDKGTAA